MLGGGQELEGQQWGGAARAGLGTETPPAPQGCSCACDALGNRPV